MLHKWFYANKNVHLLFAHACRLVGTSFLLVSDVVICVVDEQRHKLANTSKLNKIFAFNNSV